MNWDHDLREVPPKRREYNVAANSEAVATGLAYFVTMWLFAFLFVVAGIGLHIDQKSTLSIFLFCLSFVGALYVVYRTLYPFVHKWMKQHKDPR
jgi:hypothetical protein